MQCMYNSSGSRVSYKREKKESPNNKQNKQKSGSAPEHVTH
jgi:hypothetical protein